MKAFVVRVDKARCTTQWYWRPPTSSRYREPLRPDLADSRTRCCKLLSRGTRALTANHQSRSGAVLSSGVGRKPETNHGVVNYDKVTLERNQRRNHSRACVEKGEVKQQVYEDRTRRTSKIWRMMTRTERAQPTAGRRASQQQAEEQSQQQARQEHGQR